MTHVIIPCKPLDLGKSRLSGTLDPGSRRQLSSACCVSAH